MFDKVNNDQDQISSNNDLIVFEDQSRTNFVQPVIINNIPLNKKDQNNKIKMPQKNDKNFIDENNKQANTNNIVPNSTITGKIESNNFDKPIPQENIYDYKKSSYEKVLTRGGDAITSNFTPNFDNINKNQNIEEKKINDNPTIAPNKNFFEIDGGKKASLTDFTKQNVNNPSNKVNLGEIRTKKNVPINSNDEAAYLDKQFDYKPSEKKEQSKQFDNKISEKNELSSTKIISEIDNSEDINKLYEDLQKEKALKLMEYRSMIVQQKKENRETKINEEEKKVRIKINYRRKRV